MKELLSLVSKPVRYLGQEIHSIRKDPAEVKLRFCLAFPDVYEVGMSHLGIQILYYILNRQKEIACERAFAPWVDMEKVLREKKIPLSSLESSMPLNQFDILGFSLQYELSFTNVLNMLDLSHIPFFSKDRDDRFPLIIGGGPTAYNPEPIADFFDAIVIGDGEEAILEVCDLALQGKEAGGKREDLLRSLSQLKGVYVPSFHTGGERVHKKLIPDLDEAPFPICPIIPYMKVIHDRLNMEIARGCRRGCRFCEAGFIHRPYRERSPMVIHETVRASLEQTGYEEVSLLSLSAGDYSSIRPLLSTLMNRFESKKVAVSFPSLRIESVVGYLAEEVKRVRKTGFTIAPEAGTDRLRRVINKEMDEETLSQGLTNLFLKGWRNIKLYFMIGLPTEREEDLRGIVELSKKICSIGEQQKFHPGVNVSVSTFIPKPHTPFQWESQIPLEEMEEKLRFLRGEVRKNRLHLKWQDPHLSYLEGIFSMGDRNLSKVLVEAHRLGCRFDGWSDQFSYSKWREAFARTGLEMNFYTRKKRFEEPLPWSFIETGVDPRFLWEEYQRGLEEEVSPPCSGRDCHRCGVCNGSEIRVGGGSPAEVEAFGRKERRGTHKKGIRRKIRLGFSKGGDLRFISHLELVHLFYRASKRAGLLLSYSEGFHPMPKIIFAKALPVGVESLMEIVDIELEGRMDPLEVKERLNRVLPHGIEVTKAEEVLLSSSPSLLSYRSVYWIPLDHLLSKEEATTRVMNALEETELFINQQRKGRERRVDIRPLIERMAVKFSFQEVASEAEPGVLTAGSDPAPVDVKKLEEESPWGIELVLRSVAGGAAKPSEVVEAILGLKGESLSRCRIVKVE